MLPRAPGLPDEWFEHDGQITKRDIRAITLAALAPRRGETLWDVGAGSGSVAIEWMLADPANRAVAIEARHERAERIARNALNLGVPALSVVTGAAPHVFGDLPQPDAVFIGGGSTSPRPSSAPMMRCARRAPDRQRGHARNAGRLRRLARALRRRTRTDRRRPRRAGRAVYRLARGDAGRAMAADQTMSRFVAIGVGCRAGVKGDVIAALARRALADLTRRTASGACSPSRPRRTSRASSKRRAFWERR